MVAELGERRWETGGQVLIPGGLGLKVDESVLIPVGTGEPQNVSGQGSGLIKLERI